MQQQQIHTVSLFPTTSNAVLRESNVTNVPISYLNHRRPAHCSRDGSCSSPTTLMMSGRQLNPSTSCQHHQDVVTSSVPVFSHRHNDPESSPLTACNDSPRTDYRKSPESEAGDNDFAFAADDDAVSEPISRDKLPSRPLSLHHLSPSLVNQWPNSSITAAIMTGSLHQQPRSENITSLISEQLPIQEPLKPHASAVITIAHSAPTLPIVHLRQPAEPIPKYSRPSHPPPPPPPSPGRDQLQFLPFLKRYRYRFQLPEQCVGPRDLIIPGAQFHHAWHPAELVENLLGKQWAAAVKAVNTDTQTEDVDSDMDAEGSDVDDEALVPIPPPSVPTTPVKQTLKRRRSPSPAPSHDTGADSEDSDEAEVDDEDVYTPNTGLAATGSTTRVGRSARPNKRLRLNVSPSERTTRQQSATTTRPSHSTTTRAPNRVKNLQSDISREYGCQHGCESRFSTAYEARRHQEDGHGRPEAQMILEASEGQEADIFPRDCRFLINIGLNGSAKWDERTKEAVRNSTKMEDNPVSGMVATALLNFAKTWVERYICPKCKTSFSRLDSRKRHLEKQCK